MEVLLRELRQGPDGIPEYHDTEISSDELTIKGKGVPVLQGRGRGDLVITIIVQTPTKLNKRQRELLEELAGSTQIENKPAPRTLFSKVKEMFE